MAFKDRMVIALIPARGGSKGIKRKNLRFVLGKPLLAHTIEAALDAELIDEIYVSSDDAEILKLAQQMGVGVVERSPEAAADTSIASQVVADFLRVLPEAVIRGDPYLVFLQPTSPLRTGAHIDAAFIAMSAKDSNVCVSVTKLKKTPYKSFVLTSQGRLQSLFEESLTNANRQDLPVVYYPNGAIYIFPLSEFLRRMAFPSNGGIPFVMSERESIDIDSEEDVYMLEKLCSRN